MQLSEKYLTSEAASTPMPERWVDLHADYLYRFALTRLDDEQEARDLVQDTFLSALEGLQRFSGRSSERTWLTAILSNKIVDRYRKRSSGLSVEVMKEHFDEPDFFRQSDGHWNPDIQPRDFSLPIDDPLLTKEFNDVLRNCLRKLPALWNSVFRMKHLDEVETRLICQELKVSPANFWVIIHRAKLNLRECLQKTWL